MADSGLAQEFANTTLADQAHEMYARLLFLLFVFTT